eukprot:1151401-Pelagomonas_calceolata.AAC.8
MQALTPSSAANPWAKGVCCFETQVTAWCHSEQTQKLTCPGAACPWAKCSQCLETQATVCCCRLLSS